MQGRTKMLASCAALTALALIFSYIEFLIPLSITMPGIKLGLANIVIVVALYAAGVRYALLINLARVALVALLFGNMFSALYALAGAAFSFLAMLLAKKAGVFSPAGVSVAGGVFHNVGQVIVAGIVMESANIIYYFPVLLIAGLLSGAGIGILGTLILRALQIKTE